MSGVMLTPIFLGGELIVDVDSITLVNATAKEHLITVPSGERWLILTMKCHNADDVTRQILIRIYKEAAKTNEIAWLVKMDATTGTAAHWPNQDIGDQQFLFMNNAWSPIVLEAGHTIQFYYASGGASAGSVDADGVVITYLRWRY